MMDDTESTEYMRPGSNNCLCRACGLVFKGVSGFEAHRVGPYVDRRCKTKGELLDGGYAPDANGRWRIPLGSIEKVRECVT